MPFSGVQRLEAEGARSFVVGVTQLVWLKANAQVGGVLLLRRRRRRAGQACAAAAAPETWKRRCSGCRVLCASEWRVWAGAGSPLHNEVLLEFTVAHHLYLPPRARICAPPPAPTSNDAQHQHPTYRATPIVRSRAALAKPAPLPTLAPTLLKTHPHPYCLT